MNASKVRQPAVSPTNKQPSSRRQQTRTVFPAQQDPPQLSEQKSVPKITAGLEFPQLEGKL